MRPICATCGTGLAETGGCGACGSVRGTPGQAPQTDLMIVAIRCTFPCRACGFDSPLDELDGSGGAHCLKCGLHQTFPAQGWHDALPRMHAVADLAGPDPEGSRRDPTWSIVPTDFEHIGVSQAVKAIHEGTLHAKVGPGHPLCESCATPLEIVVESPGIVNTLCPGCQDTASYACNTGEFNGALVGAIGPEHRIDRADATRSSDEFLCGSCGAPLPVDGLGRLVSCPYCQAVSRIPVQQLQGLKEPPPPDVWFILFQGLSAERGRLLLDEAGRHPHGKLEPAPVGAWSAGHLALRVAVTLLSFIVGSGLAVGVWAVVWTV